MLHAKIISNLLYCRYRLSRGQSSKSTTTPTPPRMHSRDRCSGTTEPAARRRLHCSAVLISDLTCTLMAYLGRTTNWSAHAGNPRNLLGLILLKQLLSNQILLKILFKFIRTFSSPGSRGPAFRRAWRTCCACAAPSSRTPRARSPSLEYAVCDGIDL